MRQGVGSIVLHKEIHSAPEAADEVESLLTSNLDQLASAAMNSVSIESMQSQELTEDSAYGKASTSEKSVGAMPELSLSDGSNIRQSEFNLKYVSEETNLLDDSASCSNNFTRKRKAVAVGDESFDASVAKSDSEAGGVDKNKCSLRIFTNDCPSASVCTRQRTGSPKILCRKSKRSKAGAGKNIPGPSEPLMSSCLLLLEAATRLDNAEKTGTTSLSPKLQTGKQHLKISPGFHRHELSSTESQVQNDSTLTAMLKTSTHELSKNFELQCGTSTSKQPESDRHATSFGILRTTLENTDIIAECKDKVHAFKMKHFVKGSDKSAVNSSEVKIIVKDAPFPTGLFSGSKIEPQAPLSFIWNKHDNNKEGMKLSKIKLPFKKQTVKDCESASGSGTSISETLSSVTCNMSSVKSGRVIQKMVIKRAFPVMDSVQTKTFSSECDFSSSVSDIGFEADCAEIYVCSEGASQKIAEINTGADEIKEFSDTSLSSPSLHWLKEHTFLSSSNEKLCRSDSSTTPLFSVVNSHDICFSNSTETKTYTVMSLPNSLGSVTVSPAPAVRTVTFAATSCHPTPSEVLPIYSQAEIKESSKSLDLHQIGNQNVIPSKTDSAIASSYILSNCPTDSAESSLLIMQNKDVFIIEPRKQIIKDIAFKAVSAPSSYSATTLAAEVKTAAPSEDHEGKQSQGLLDPGEEHNEAWQGQSHKVSARFRPGLLASTDIKEEIEETSLSVIVNKMPVAVDNMNAAGGAHSEMLDSNKPQSQDNVLCELASTICDKASLHTHSLSLPHAGTSVNVQSLTQLCKKYFAHLFTTLDNQTSESDENDSVTESPQCELKDEKPEMNDLTQAVTLQQKLSSLKSEAMWQDINSTCRLSGNNVTIGIKITDDKTDVSDSPRSLGFQSQSTVTVDVSSRNTGMVSSRSDCLGYIHEVSLDSPSSPSLSLAEQAPNYSRQPSVASYVSVDTSSATTAVPSVDTAFEMMADVSDASVVTSSPISAEISNVSS